MIPFRAVGRSRGWSLALALALAAVLLLFGCVRLLKSKTTPSIYTLTPPENLAADAPEVDWQLSIEEPTAARAVDTDRIVLFSTPNKLQYFADSRWSDRAPRMVQLLLLESFENSGKIVGVERLLFGVRGDYSLRLDMRAFQAEYVQPDAPPRVAISFNFKLLLQPQSTILASRTFSRETAAPVNELDAVVTTFDAALREILIEAVDWTLREAEAHRRAAEKN